MFDPYNEIISQGFVKSYSTHKMNCGYIFCLKIVKNFTAKASHIFFFANIIVFLHLIRFQILMSL